MYFCFLIEDHSTEVLIRTLMGKITEGREDVEYDCKAFHGIGGYQRKSTPKDIKTGKLLNDLPHYLRGFNKQLQSIPDSAIVIVLDSDDRDIVRFRTELETIAAEQEISVDYVFCLAVEEMEAWLLGDKKAVRAAYPGVKDKVLCSYEQDSICGTWEALANAVYEGGLTRLRENCTSYAEIGAIKTEWAQKIGKHMCICENCSPSFQAFIAEIKKRLPCLPS